MKKLLLIVMTLFLLNYSYSEVSKKTEISGLASYYGDGFEGKKTASGEIFHKMRLTAAHKFLPFGTLLKVTNLSNNKSVIVKVNDRGPFVEGRILDLSYKAAQELGYLNDGVAYVRAEIISKSDNQKEEQSKHINNTVSQEKKEPLKEAEDAKAVNKMSQGAVLKQDTVVDEQMKVNRIFVIQFGAFSTEERAQNYQKVLEAKGIKTYIAKEGNPERVLYKVREHHTYRDIQQLFSKVMDYKSRGIEAFAVGKFFVKENNNEEA